MMGANRFYSIRRVCLVFVLVFSALAVSSAAHADVKTNFFKAVEMDRPDVIERLLKQGLDPNITEPGHGNSGLIVAVQEDSMRVFNLLVNTAGVDLNKQADNGNTAIMIASWKSNVPAVKTLLEKGASVNKNGWTALHYASAVGNQEIAKMLLNQKARVNALAPNGTTPLMMASRSGHIKIVKLLLDNGADITLRNEWGMNAVDFARDNDHTSLEKALQRRLDTTEATAAMKSR
jgi:hypothetical protein